mmetsp:Transcript_10946/g.13409  ORF Transcript_10946/g.13409 Transcript_10946/m.13409 type:complete len:107 (-) Transcript_10946:301-621(-)
MLSVLGGSATASETASITSGSLSPNEFVFFPKEVDTPESDSGDDVPLLTLFNPLPLPPNNNRAATTIPVTNVPIPIPIPTNDTKLQITILTGSSRIREHDRTKREG